LIVREMAGKFPATSAEWRDLPGIGRYTAAAIASIVFAEPVAVVDGNVERVLQRTAGQTLSGESLWQAAEHLLDRKRPGDFNQAMMELGATVCTPRTPACLTCPVMELCNTRGELASSRKQIRAERNARFTYALNHRNGDGDNGEVFLVQRARDASLMAGMWELPELPSGNGAASPLFTLRHSITVTDYTVRVWRKATPSCVKGKWIQANRLRQVALTGLARKILRKAEVL
jgi:A/G-specific adenine glycosylase